MIEILKKAINLFGAENQENMCIEECAELIQAINKKHRGLKHNIPEEIADVEIMLEQLKIINCCRADVERIKQKKMQRLSEKVGAKMTDNEIIKALECCVSSTGSEACNGCPFNVKDICEKDSNALAKFSLDLINRQKAEIKKKDTEIDILIRKKETLRNEISELQRKNFELEIELNAMRGAANSYKSRAEGLQMDNEQLHSDIVNANQNFDHIKELWEAEKEKVANTKTKVIEAYKKLQTARDKAYNKFAERLQAMFEQYATYDTLHIYEIIDRIDIVLDELTEGNGNA